MPAPTPLTEEEVIQWIEYYEQGHDIPDDVMVQLFHMAHILSKTKLAALNTAVQLVATINDPHSSIAYVCRWSNQLEQELMQLGVIQSPKEPK